MEADSTSVLVVTKDSKISSPIAQMLVAPLFDVTICGDFNEARRKINGMQYKIIIVDSGDGSDSDFAVDVSDTLSSVMLLAPLHLFDQISYRAEPYGILTLAKPFDSFYFYNMIKIALAVQAKVQRISSRTVKLKEKMEEIRIVNRAKLLLVQKRNMTEQEAHRFIEKEAMDRCIKRIDVAHCIIEEEC